MPRFVSTIGHNFAGDRKGRLGQSQIYLGPPSVKSERPNNERFPNHRKIFRKEHIGLSKTKTIFVLGLGANTFGTAPFSPFYRWQNGGKMAVQLATLRARIALGQCIASGDECWVNFVCGSQGEQ